MSKLVTYIGWFVVAMLAFGFFFGAGTGEHLEQGSLMNPLETGYGFGVEVPRVANNIRRVYFRDLFNVGDGEDDTNSGATSGDFESGSRSNGSGSGSGSSSSAPSSSPSNGSSLDGRSNTPLPWQRGGALNPCNGPYDINCDGSVNDADAELAKQFQTNPGNN